MSCQVMRANFTIVNRMQIGRFIPVNDENQPYVFDSVTLCTCYNSTLGMKMMLGVEVVVDLMN